jgi:PST family polysaccharide transporter
MSFKNSKHNSTMTNSEPLWLKLVPNFIRIRLLHRTNFLSVLHNMSWLFIDKIVRMGLGLFVGLWTARYLGVEKFGLLNYSIAFATIFGSFAGMGLDSIVTRDLVKDQKRHQVLLGSAFLLKVLGGSVAFIASLIFILLTHGNETLLIWLVGISAAGFLFQSVNVIDFYFQSKVQSKYTVFASCLAFILVAAVKVLLIINSAPLVAFAWVGLCELILTAIFLLLAYKVNQHYVSGWRYEKKVILDLLNQSWPLLLAGFAVTLYMKVDLVMLKEMSDDRSVGIYAAATRFSEIWYFLPMVIVASVSPSLIRYHATNPDLYLSSLRKLYFVMAWLAIGLAIPFSFFSAQVINLFLGIEFADAAPVLAIHLWAGLAVFLGIASSQYLVIEKLQKISFYRTLIGLVSNILLNLILIPTMGAMGAAIATVASYFLATFSLVFFERTRSHSVFLLFAPISRN